MCDQHDGIPGLQPNTMHLFHRLDTEKAPKEGSYSQEGDVTRPPSNDQEGAVREAVRLARIEWLKERET